MTTRLADPARALAATDAEHAVARDTTRCPICGAAPGAECVYGLFGPPAGQPPGPTSYPGKVHTRRLRVYLGNAKSFSFPLDERRARRYIEDMTTTYGNFLIYGNGELEGECSTGSGAKRMIAKLRRLGMAPTARRHAWDEQGRHYNVDCGTKNLKIRLVATPQIPAALAIPVPSLRPAYVEVRREEWPDGSSTTLPFAIRVF